MRDLEIRGAGSLLGEIQHGHLEQVGYDTYCKLLDEVIKEMKGIKVTEEVDVQIDLNVTSYIPDSYISDSSQKIEIYQNIALCRNEEDIQDVIDEIIDRFGNMPQELEKLTEIARIKNLAKSVNVIKISNKPGSIVFTFDNSNFDVDINKLVDKYKSKVRISPGVKPIITIKISDEKETVLIDETKYFLKLIQKSEK